LDLAGTVNFTISITRFIIIIIAAAYTAVTGSGCCSLSFPETESSTYEEFASIIAACNM
jgi:hypothetical protein